MWVRRNRWTWMEKARAVRMNRQCSTPAERGAELAALDEELTRKIARLSGIVKDEGQPWKKRFDALGTLDKMLNTDYQKRVLSMMPPSSDSAH